MIHKGVHVYKVVRTDNSVPPQYFESRLDALTNRDYGLSEAEIIPLYTADKVPVDNEMLEENEQLRTLIELLRANPGRDVSTDLMRIENDKRCARFGCDGRDQLQWKWRNPETLPKEFDYAECEAAILDAFIRQGGANVWSGDGSSCAVQIVKAVWDKMKAAEDKVKELESKLNPPEEPTC